MRNTYSNVAIVILLHLDFYSYIISLYLGMNLSETNKPLSYTLAIEY